MCEYSITRLEIFTNLSLTRIFISFRAGETLVRKAYERRMWKSGQDLYGGCILKQSKRANKLKYISYSAHLSRADAGTFYVWFGFWFVERNGCLEVLLEVKKEGWFAWENGCERLKRDGV